MLLLDLRNSGFFLSKVRFNRILKNSLRALKKLAQLLQVLANVHPCHPLQKTTETVPVLIIALNKKTGLLLEFN